MLICRFSIAAHHRYWKCWPFDEWQLVSAASVISNYNQAAGGFCSQCGTPRKSPTAKFCSSCKPTLQTNSNQPCPFSRSCTDNATRILALRIKLTGRIPISIIIIDYDSDIPFRLFCISSRGTAHLVEVIEREREGGKLVSTWLILIRSLREKISD